MNKPAVKVRRNLTLAAIMSLMVAGLGQLYNGQLQRAIFFMVPELVMAFVSHIVLPTSFWGMAVVFVSVLAWRFVSVCDAVREGHRLGAIVLKPYNAFGVYVAVALAVFVYQEGLRLYKNETSFRISGVSGLPTLTPGDYVMGSGRTPIYPERGQLIAFRHPKNHDTVHIMRVVGLPGENVQMIAGKPHINGKPVVHSPIEDFVSPPHAGASVTYRQYVETLPNGKSYRTLDQHPDGPLDNTEAFTVPSDHYFVLGDNRDNVLDSRTPMIGTVPVHNIVQKLDYVWWSQDLSRVSTRLD